MLSKHASLLTPNFEINGVMLRDGRMLYTQIRLTVNELPNILTEIAAVLRLIL